MPKVWKSMTKQDRQRAADLIGTIDAGERFLFEHGEADPAFKGLLCNRMLVNPDLTGVFSACAYGNGIHISIAFDNDEQLQGAFYQATAELLREVAMSSDREISLWCRSENDTVRKLIEQVTRVQPNYGSFELSVRSLEFAAWNAPILSNGYSARRYEPCRHTEYIRLLEEAMAHVSAPNTTPYWDQTDQLKKRFLQLEEAGRFHALWQGDRLAGLCYSDGAEVDTLAVGSCFRRQGLGYFLLLQALCDVFAAGEEQARLYVVDQNPDALAFYQKSGMQITAHSVRYYRCTHA